MKSTDVRKITTKGLELPPSIGVSMCLSVSECVSVHMWNVVKKIKQEIMSSTEHNQIWLWFLTITALTMLY